jgi:hypothetical protein
MNSTGTVGKNSNFFELKAKHEKKQELERWVFNKA